MFTSYKSNFQDGHIAELTRFSDLNQRAKVGMLCRQNERNSSLVRLAQRWSYVIVLFKYFTITDKSVHLTQGRVPIHPLDVTTN